MAVRYSEVREELSKSAAEALSRKRAREVGTRLSWTRAQTLICTLGEVNKPRSGIGDKPESEKKTGRFKAWKCR